MNAREIRMIERDMVKLRELIEEAKRGDPRKAAELRDLETELDRATLLAEEEMPGDVVRMRSEVQLVDVETGEELTCQLVFPAEADIEQMRISVLAPVGTAILGFRAGDRFKWPVPGGTRDLMIKAVRQSVVA